MDFEYDPEKNSKNIRQHGLSFADVHMLDWDAAVYREDIRKEYGEVRVQAFTFDKDKKLYMVAFTVRHEKIRVISFRRANKREEKIFLGDDSKERSTHNEKRKKSD